MCRVGVVAHYRSSVKKNYIEEIYEDLMNTVMPFSVVTNDAVECEIEIAAPPDRVFEALTDEKQLSLWFNNPECPVKEWKFDARPGGRYNYSTRKETMVVNAKNQFQCHGEIVEFDPPRLLAYTWIGNWHNDQSLKTLVRYELTTRGKGTHVKVTHSGLASEDVARKDYSGGWPGVLASLKDFTEKTK